LSGEENRRVRTVQKQRNTARHSPYDERKLGQLIDELCGVGTPRSLQAAFGVMLFARR
jgi:hypothetical protein